MKDIYYQSSEEFRFELQQNSDVVVSMDSLAMAMFSHL